MDNVPSASDRRALMQAKLLNPTIGLPLAVLYGLGVTVGAGIYFLIAVAASHAGPYATLSFAIAAGVSGLTGATFAELVGRFPVSAGEAAYVQAGFRSEALALIVGVLVVVAATIATATIAHGSAGYLALLINLPMELLVLTVLASLGGVAMAGMSTSATIAGMMTLIEVVGLITIVFLGAWEHPGLLRDVSAVWPASLPWAIFLILGIATLLYILVAWVALRLRPTSANA